MAAKRKCNGYVALKNVAARFAMSALGQEQTFRAQMPKSPLPLKADID
jgi:hypothetical protein